MFGGVSRAQRAGVRAFQGSDGPCRGWFLPWGPLACLGRPSYVLLGRPLTSAASSGADRAGLRPRNGERPGAQRVCSMCPKSASTDGLGLGRRLCCWVDAATAHWHICATCLPCLAACPSTHPSFLSDRPWLLARGSLWFVPRPGLQLNFLHCAVSASASPSLEAFGTIRLMLDLPPL